MVIIAVISRDGGGLNSEIDSCARDREILAAELEKNSNRSLPRCLPQRNDNLRSMEPVFDSRRETRSLAWLFWSPRGRHGSHARWIRASGKGRAGFSFPACASTAVANYHGETYGSRRVIR